MGTGRGVAARSGGGVPAASLVSHANAGRPAGLPAFRFDDRRPTTDHGPWTTDYPYFQALTAGIGDAGER